MIYDVSEASSGNIFEAGSIKFWHPESMSKSFPQVSLGELEKDKNGRSRLPRSRKERKTVALGIVMSTKTAVRACLRCEHSLLTKQCCRQAIGLEATTRGARVSKLRLMQMGH